MSLNSRKSIDKAGPDLHDEDSVTFRREPDKTYMKITKIRRRDRKTGEVKSMKRLDPVEEGPFEITQDPENYDEKLEYQGIDGKTKFTYLRKCEVSENG